MAVGIKDSNPGGRNEDPEQLRQQEESTPRFTPPGYTEYDPRESNPYAGSDRATPRGDTKGVRLSDSKSPDEHDKSPLSKKAGSDKADTKNNALGSAGAMLASGISPPSVMAAGEIMKRLKGLKGFFWGSNKRKAGSVGGVAGLIGLVVTIFILSYSSGPLEFVHIAKLLTHAHIDLISEHTDKRLAKMLFRQFGNKDLTPGETRMSWLERTYANAVEAHFKSKGIIPKYEPDTGYFKGFTLDTTSPGSKYHGMSMEDAVNAAEADLGGKLKIDTGVRPGTADVWDGTLKISGDGFFGDSAALKGMVGVSGDAKIVQWINIRELGEKGLVPSAFHLFRRFSNDVSQKKDALIKSFMDSLFKGEESGTQGVDVTTDSAPEEVGTDKNGKPITQNVDIPSGPMQEGGVTDTLKGIASSTGGKVAGIGIGAVIAVICAMYEINKNLGIIRFAQVIVPLMSMATTAITPGNQIMAGQDVNVDEMGAFAKQYFNQYDANGKFISNWSQSAPIRADYGQTGGIDMDPTIKQTFDDHPAWLAWTNNGAIGALCSQVTAAITTTIQIAILFIPGANIVGGAIELAAGGLAGVLSGPLLDSITHWLAGAAVNVATSGAQWGNDIDYGAALAGNENSLQYGGVALTSQQVAQNNVEMQAQDASNFHQLPLFARLFNPDDYRSLLGNLIDQLNITSPQAAVAKIGTFPDIIGSILSMPSTLLTSSVHAAVTPYQYPFPTFGFSEEDDNNPLVADPYENADAVAKLLDSNNTNGQPDYISKALDCFGIAITKGPQGWDATPSTNSNDSGVDRTHGINAYDDAHYSQQDCIHPSGFDQSNWLRVRYWIMDTRTIEGYACYMGDDTSCQESGFTVAPQGTGGINPSGVTFVSQRDPQWATDKAFCGTYSECGCVLAVESMIISTFTHQFVSPVTLNDTYGSWNDPYGKYGLQATGMWGDSTGRNQYGFKMPATSNNVLSVADAVRKGALVAVYSFDTVRRDPFWGTGGHEELIYGVEPNGDFLVYDPWDMPDPNNPTQPDPASPGDRMKHSLTAWPESDFIGSKIGFDIITQGAH